MSTNTSILLPQYHAAVYRMRIKLALWDTPEENIGQIRRLAILICRQEPGIEPDELLKQYVQTIQTESEGLLKPITPEEIAVAIGQTTAVPLPEGVYAPPEVNTTDGVRMFMGPGI